MIYIHKKLKMNLIDNIPNSLTCVKNFVHCIAQSAPHCPIASCWSMRQKTELLDDYDEVSWSIWRKWKQYSIDLHKWEQINKLSLIALSQIVEAWDKRQSSLMMMMVVVRMIIRPVHRTFSWNFQQCQPINLT